MTHRESMEKGSRRVVFHSQKDPALNAMDPITYILTLALKFGVVERTKIGIVQWRKPHYPVLPAYDPNSSVVFVSKPVRC